MNEAHRQGSSLRYAIDGRLFAIVLATTRHHPNPVSKVDIYLDAAERRNTRGSYESAIRHFEVEWGGSLPATSEAVARYLADHAELHSVSTLRLRLAALARWHADHGFADPTKTTIVRQLLKGIRASHPEAAKQARPLQIDALQKMDAWFDAAIAQGF